jgi:hypothetical protein
MKPGIRKYENLHILLWLVKDACWLQDYKIAGVIMIVPTLLAAWHITWLSRKNLTELLHNLAVSFWIMANSIWMIGELFFDDTTRPYALIFFILGLLPVSYYYLYLLPLRYFRSKHSS